MTKKMAWSDTSYHADQHGQLRNTNKLISYPNLGFCLKKGKQQAGMEIMGNSEFI